MPIYSSVSHVYTTFGPSRVYRQNGGGEQIVLVPGFLEGYRHYGPLIGSLARRGLDALTYSQPRQSVRKLGKTSVERHATIMRDVAEALPSAQGRRFCVAHSMGAPTAVEACVQMIEDGEELPFAGLMALEPLGLTAPQSATDMALRGLGKAFSARSAAELPGPYKPPFDQNETIEDTLARGNRARAVSLLLGAQQLRVTFDEVRAATQYDIRPAVNQLAAFAGSSMTIDFVLAYGDELLPTAEAYQQARQLGANVTLHSVAARTAGHDTTWVHPELTANLIELILKPKRSPNQ